VWSSTGTRRSCAVARRLIELEQLKSGATDPSEVKYVYDGETGLLKHRRHYKTDTTYDEEDYEYSDLGALSLRRFPNGDTVTYVHSVGSASSTGDLTNVNYSNATASNVTYNAYDRMGRPTQITDATGSRTFAYGANGGLSLSLENLNDTFYGSGNDISRHYEGTGTGELEGRYQGLAYDGVDWDLTYDAASGRISTIAGDRAGGSNAFAYTYAAQHVSVVSQDPTARSATSRAGGRTCGRCAASGAPPTARASPGRASPTRGRWTTIPSSTTPAASRPCTGSRPTPDTAWTTTRRAS